jgi:hypothetical protein
MDSDSIPTPYSIITRKKATKIYRCPKKEDESITPLFIGGF